MEGTLAMLMKLGVAEYRCRRSWRFDPVSVTAVATGDGGPSEPGWDYKSKWSAAPDIPGATSGVSRTAASGVVRDGLYGAASSRRVKALAAAARLVTSSRV